MINLFVFIGAKRMLVIIFFLKPIRYKGRNLKYDNPILFEFQAVNVEFVWFM
jgi:hypothetical protein